jgi:hypothetical protein
VVVHYLLEVADDCFWEVVGVVDWVGVVGWVVVAYHFHPCVLVEVFFYYFLGAFSILSVTVRDQPKESFEDRQTFHRQVSLVMPYRYQTILVEVQKVYH